MSNKRKIEIFSAGCGACDKTIRLVNQIACESSEVDVLDMHQADVAERAKAYGINTIPSVVIDGKIADCCASQGVDEQVLKAAGLGIPLP